MLMIGFRLQVQYCTVCNWPHIRSIWDNTHLHIELTFISVCHRTADMARGLMHTLTPLVSDRSALGSAGDVGHEPSHGELLIPTSHELLGLFLVLYLSFSICSRTDFQKHDIQSQSLVRTPP